MNEPAPKGIQYTDQQTADLHNNVVKHSTEAGHPTTLAEVNPDDDSPLKDIQDTLGKTAVHLANSVGGEGPTTNIETVSGSKVVSFMRKMQRFKSGIKKAA